MRKEKTIWGAYTDEEWLAMSCEERAEAIRDQIEGFEV